MIAAIVLALFLGDLAVVEGAESPWKQFVHDAMAKDFAPAESWTKILDLAGLTAAVYLMISLSVYFGASVGRQAAWRQDLPTHALILNSTLCVGAVLLVTGIFRIWMLLNWSLDYVDPGALVESQRPILDSAARVANGIVNSRGVLYTGMLAALYVPASILLSLQAREAGVADNWTERERQEWDGLFSPRESVLRVAAILGPALTGPAADYLAFLG